MKQITVPETPTIVSQILDLPLESVVIVKTTTGSTEVLVRTGVDGWLTLRRTGPTPMRSTYLHQGDVRTWVNALLGDDATFWAAPDVTA